MSGTSSPLPSGESSYASTIATANTAEEVQFADRFGYVAVTNTGSAPIFVTGDGSTPVTSGASTSVAVAPNETRVIANGLPLWYQGSKVIAKGSNQFGGGNTQTSPSSPGSVTPMESLAGQMTNPGTTIKLISGTAGTGYSVEGTG